MADLASSNVVREGLEVYTIRQEAKVFSITTSKLLKLTASHPGGGQSAAAPALA